MPIVSYKYRIYPTKEQEILLEKTFGCVRFVYNKCLELKSSLYKLDKKNISIFKLDKEVKFWKSLEETKWLKEVNAQSLQSSLRNLDKAYTRFFKKQGGFPNFKSKNNNKTFCNPQFTRTSFKESKLFIPKFKNGIKCIFHREFEGKIKCSIVSKNKTGKYFVTIVVENGAKEKEIKITKFNTCVGIDLGIKTYATYSDGTKIENPKHLKKKLKQLRRASRKHSKKKKGSKNKEKSRLKLAKIYEKVTNCRKDFLHKITTNLVNNQDYQSFAIEDLAVSNMIKNKRLAREISDAAWGTFRQLLEYKAAWAGKEVIIIGRFEPSSKICSCGKINQSLSLKDRNWTCSCGATHDRDILAANNIKHFAFCKQSTYNDTSLVRQELSEPSRKRKTLLEKFDRVSLKEEIIKL